MSNIDNIGEHSLKNETQMEDNLSTTLSHSVTITTNLVTHNIQNLTMKENSLNKDNPYTKRVKKKKKARKSVAHVLQDSLISSKTTNSKVQNLENDIKDIDFINNDQSDMKNEVVNCDNGINIHQSSSSNNTNSDKPFKGTVSSIQNVQCHPLLSLSTLNIQQKSRQSCKPHKGLSKNKTKKTNNVPDEKYIFDSRLFPEEVEIRLQNGSLIEGYLRINRKQYQHAYISSDDRSEQDILIDGVKNRNRALEGDLVVVEIIDQVKDDLNETNDNKQKLGKVVFIKEKVHNRTCIGNLKLMADKNRQKALFIPRDHRMPRLNIPCIYCPDNFFEEAKKYENTLFLAKILHWSDTRFALGKIIGIIGQCGDLISESKAILAQADLDITPFGVECRQFYPRLDFSICEEEIMKRKDLRQECLFSIDPFNCRDIDDAVSCKELENGNYEIGVHISDVTHFLLENTVLDELVANKATTVYMVEKAYHMLPDELCMLCSLFPGVDKLAFSVVWEINKDSEIVSQNIFKSVIHSCCQLAYEHAQAILEDSTDECKFPEIYNGFTYEDISKSIKTLGRISQTLRQRRFQNGALRIDQPKIAVSLNPASGLPKSFTIYENKASHQLIEEFMLLANMSVAKKIYEDYPKLAFLRCHPEPSNYMLQQLAKSLKPLGVELDVTTAGDLYRSLLPYIGPDAEDKSKAMVLNMLCTKPMTRAKYFCADSCDTDDFHHYALNVPLYTHFTSPIRRYADIMVHRLLSASLKYREPPQWQVDKVQMVAAQCNKQKYNAKIANEMCVEMYLLKYIEMNSPVVTEAAVVDIRERSVDVIILGMGLNRRIYFNNDFPGTIKLENESGTKLSKMQVIWTATDSKPEIVQDIEIFSTIKVDMHKTDDLFKIKTNLSRPA